MILACPSQYTLYVAICTIEGCANVCHIKVKYNISNRNVSFLDVQILKNENCTLSTEIHIKCPV